MSPLYDARFLLTEAIRYRKLDQRRLMRYCALRWRMLRIVKRVIYGTDYKVEYYPVGNVFRPNNAADCEAGYWIGVTI